MNTFLCFSTVWCVRLGLCEKSDHYVSHVDHACGGCAVALLQSRLRGGPAIHLSLRCGPATEQADKSTWTLDATRCFRDSTEQVEEHVQDMHERRRTFSICAIRARAQQQHVETKGVAPATALLSKCLVPTSLRDCYRAFANRYV